MEGARLSVHRHPLAETRHAPDASVLLRVGICIIMLWVLFASSRAPFGIARGVVVCSVLCAVLCLLLLLCVCVLCLFYVLRVLLLCVHLCCDISFCVIVLRLPLRACLCAFRRLVSVLLFRGWYPIVWLEVILELYWQQILDVDVISYEQMPRTIASTSASGEEPFST